jgi:hypothetical protein
MEQIEATPYYYMTWERLQRIIKKFYEREYVNTEWECFYSHPGHYIVRADQTSDSEAPYHLGHAQQFKETGDFCPLFILLSALAYRKEIPSGRYLIKVARGEQVAV